MEKSGSRFHDTTKYSLSFEEQNWMISQIMIYGLIKSNSDAVTRTFNGSY
jgi:hypothetical protein